MKLYAWCSALLIGITLSCLVAQAVEQRPTFNAVLREARIRVYTKIFEYDNNKFFIWIWVPMQESEVERQCHGCWHDVLYTIKPEAIQFETCVGAWRSLKKDREKAFMCVKEDVRDQVRERVKNLKK